MPYRYLAIAWNEISSLYKERTLLLLLSVFFAMTIVSSYIGWSARHIIQQVYQASVDFLIKTKVKDIPPNPFADTPPLSLFSNMIIYMVLIGALLAIIVGHRSFIRDRRAGVNKIIFTKALSRTEVLVGKLAGILGVLSLTVFAAFAISVVASMVIPGGSLSAPDMTKLFLFHVVSLLYLFVFALLGLFFALYAKTESLALFIPIMIWIAISFGLPELTSALSPTASLNPTNLSKVAPHGDFFAAVQGLIRPISLSQNYKEVSSYFLDADDLHAHVAIGRIVTTTAWELISLVLSAGVLLLGCFAAIGRYNVCEDTVDA